MPRHLREIARDSIFKWHDQAASDYLDQASADKKATDAWKAQKQAVTNGLSAAKANFGKAPDRSG